MKIYERMRHKNFLLALYAQEDRLADQLMTVRLKRSAMEERLTEEGESGVIAEAHEAFVHNEAPVKFIDDDGLERILA